MATRRNVQPFPIEQPRADQLLDAKPFLKWAGGKRQLSPAIIEALPRHIQTYYEPFVGGGAVFFALAIRGRFEHAVLIDHNPDIIKTYRVVQREVDALVQKLRVHAKYATDPEYYYKLRAVSPASLSSVEHAARLIYLNKTGYNGLYRVNRQGHFNVPFGRYKNPTICNEPLLRACSMVLTRVELITADFGDVAGIARPGDAIYFDPPYVPLSQSSSFTAYDPYPFGEAEHRRLAIAFRACCAQNVAAVLSNSDCPLTRELYAGLDVRTVYATRAINSVPTKRGPVSEILVVHSVR